MVQLSVFNIQELLEHILHFLAVDKSLYPLYLLDDCGIDAVLLFYGSVLS